MSELTLRGGRIVTPAGMCDGDVVVRDGRIAGVVDGGVGADHRGGGTHHSVLGEAASGVIDLDGRWVLPGFIDLHVHGGGGAQFNTDDAAEVHDAARFHAQHGTTALLATTVSAPPEELLAALGAIGEAVNAPVAGTAAVIGAHLEGPFLSRAWPGAMDAATFLDPEKLLTKQLLAAGPVRSTTIAPELPGALESIARFAEAGALVSLGHSDARFAHAEAAVAAGARAVTHAYNAMRPLHHRDPGLLGAALDLPDLHCEVICDGVHVDPVAVRLLQRVKGPARTLLVTDAIEATGLPDGDYRLGGRAVTVTDGRATLAGSETIAGATLTMDRALRNAVVFCDASLADAARMAATTPAELLGIADRKGSIAPGLDADLVILEPDLTLAAVLVRGAWARPPLWQRSSVPGATRA
ncbi:MAG TPA: N-acetylglucosamine-6-phosphate deacetylase [Conexibacter sp.]|jgi:N-acetylglucosamine-6-phosphate deacetylase